jgi:hypothetical protein
MRAIEIRRNGYAICTAGVSHATLLIVDLSANVEDMAAALSVHGMADSGNAANLHLWWMDHLQINDGDELEFALIETDKVTPPLTAEASDSPEFISKQAEYERELVTKPLMPRTMRHSHFGVTFKIRKDKEQVNAQLQEPKEFLSMLLNWNNFGEERGRFSASSFSQVDALNRAGKQDWMSGDLELDEKLTVQVVYNSAVNVGAAQVSPQLL